MPDPQPDLMHAIDARRREALLAAGWTRIPGACEMWKRPGEFGLHSLESAYAVLEKEKDRG